MAVRLGELLLREKRVTPTQLQEALTHQRANGGRLGTTLVKLGFLKDEDVTEVLSRQYGVPAIDLRDFELDAALVRLIPGETAAKYNVIPVTRTGNTLTLAMTDPTNVFAMDDIKFRTGLHVEPVVASDTAIREAVAKHYGSAGQGQAQAAGGKSMEMVNRALEDLNLDAQDELQVVDGAEEIDAASLERQSGEAPVIRLANALFLAAIQRGASDIHIEPYEKEMRVRFRIDGVLQPVMAPPLKYRDPLVSRIKIMARLDIAEKRLPQDGRIKARFNDRGQSREIDFRVSVLPTLFGEKIVLRLLDAKGLRLDMTQLGFDTEALDRFERAIHKPWGMVLVTGPTGSGKTNTLYSALDPAQRARREHHDRRGSGRIQSPGHQPGAGARADRPHVRRRAAVVPAPGPEHHSRRRGPRCGDRRDRRQGGAHGPPRAVDAAHQRRAEQHQPSRQHGH